MDLNVLWYVLLGILMTGYAILDGFDLGVGVLHLGARTDKERRIFLNSIGPLWDGNEVWLVTFGGALFAAFPEVYRTAFPAFYLAFILLLFALIFRAVSIEFRSKFDNRLWRQAWDIAFSVSSTLTLLLFGVAVGNAMLGIPIDANREFTGTFIGLLRPFPIAVGLMSVAIFTMHGAFYLYLKTEGELQERIKGWMWKTFYFFLTMYIITTIWAVLGVPLATAHFMERPLLWLAPIISVAAIANIVFAMKQGKPAYAFISSIAVIVTFNMLFGAALFPDMLVSSTDPANTLNIYNAASSQKTLFIMTIIAVLGLPFVLAYTSVVYWTFRGKVEMGEFSY